MTAAGGEPAEPAEAPLHDQVRYAVDDGVAVITLNRPAAGNAITPDQRERVIDLLGQASSSVEVRVVVVAATGERFCTGADLRAARPSAAPRPPGAPERVIGDVARMIRGGAQRLIGAVLDCERPVIASVNGTAAGLGAHLAFACDLVVAAEDARFVEVFVRRGIAPDGGGAYLLPRLVGLQRAKELVFLGDDLSAADAARIGLVNRVVPRPALADETGALARRLAEGPTRAIAAAKWLLNRSFESDRDTAFGEEALVQDLIMHSVDAQEGVRAFVERRKPRFGGF